MFHRRWLWREVSQCIKRPRFYHKTTDLHHHDVRGDGGNDGSGGVGGGYYGGWIRMIIVVVWVKMLPKARGFSTKFEILQIQIQTQIQNQYKFKYN